MNSPKQQAHRAPALDWVTSHGMSDYVYEGVERLARRRSKRRVAMAGSLGLVLVGAGIAAWLVPYLRSHSEVTTPAGIRQTLVLADGSHVELNARTHAVADVGTAHRVVRLTQGEAFFQVTKDPAHPFLVETPYGAVRVTGTQFDVRLTSDGEDVTLVEGSVVVRSNDAKTQDFPLVPDQQLRFGHSTSKIETLALSDVENAMAWRRGRAEFRGASLGEAVERFADFHGVEISVSRQVAQLRLGGSYALDDLPSFLGALQSTLPVKVTARPDGSYQISAR